MAPRPVLVYDGDCGFCRLWVDRWRQATGDRVEYLPSGQAAARFPALKDAPLDEAVHLVSPDGSVTRGAEAVFRSLAAAGGVSRTGLILYERLPGFRPACEALYRAVAARRPLFSRATRVLWGGAPARAPLEGARRLFLAGLGLVYLAAFWSFGVQVRGLVGVDGILPAAPMLAAAARMGPGRFLALPTLAWFASSDGALVAFCAAGALAALGLLLDLAAGPCALAAWALYLSLVGVGGDFMRFQWDGLLLETGLLAVFVAPWSWGAARRTAASRGAFLLVRLLLVKLMLESAVVKLTSGDAAWRALTALEYHHWTQPLPTPLAWAFAALPAAVHRACCLAMFAVEFGAPLLLLGPRRVRALGAAAIAALMALIALSGNYGFFGLLTVVLCASALDDAPAWVARLAPRAATAPASPLRARAVGAFAALWVGVSALVWSLQQGMTPPLAAAWTPVLRAVSPLQSIEAYGLFAAMTTTRDEIAVEVSADGRDWREWPFRWKPGDPRRGGSFVAPHMPRLDWQMWFAALGAPSPWFNNLLFRLLQGSPAVEALLGPSPLGGEKPVYARATLWSYRFATPAERRADGLRWRRARKGLYFPVVSLTAAP